MSEDEEQDVLDDLIEMLQHADGDFAAIRGSAQALIDDARARGMRIGERFRLRGHAGLPFGMHADWDDYVDAFFAEIGRRQDP